MLTYLKLEKVIVDENKKPAFAISTGSGKQYITPVQQPKIKVKIKCRYGMPKNLQWIPQSCYISSMLQCIFWNEKFLNIVANSSQSSNKIQLGKLIGKFYLDLGKQSNTTQIEALYKKLLQKFTEAKHSTELTPLFTFGKISNNRLLVTDVMQYLEIDKNKTFLVSGVKFRTDNFYPIETKTYTTHYLNGNFNFNITKKIKNLNNPEAETQLFILKYPEIAIVIQNDPNTIPPKTHLENWGKNSLFKEVYKIFAVIAYHNNNHFIAYLKIENKDGWYKMDDLLPTGFNISNVEASNIFNGNPKKSIWSTAFYKKVK